MLTANATALSWQLIDSVDGRSDYFDFEVDIFAVSTVTKIKLLSKVEILPCHFE